MTSFTQDRHYYGDGGAHSREAQHGLIQSPVTAAAVSGPPLLLSKYRITGTVQLLASGGSTLGPATPDLPA
ncbi:hypothetical protein [Streptomyces sp. NPDC007083]|uniref:hypothetical protein n=1 Tax=unclassified Streptomyces TaxID=2593676 RepID=UPI0033F3EBB1